MELSMWFPNIHKKLDRILINQAYMIKNLLPPKPPLPPEPPPPTWFDRSLPKEQWAKEINGLRVGYVQVSRDTPLWYVDGDNIPNIYQSEQLRGLKDLRGQRIVAKAYNWVMVYAHGDLYAGFGDVRPFGDVIDGDGAYYLAMREQSVDGIMLDEDMLPQLYVNAAHVERVFIIPK